MDRLRILFSELGVDALLVSHLPNIRYLCGFSGSAGLLLVEATSSTLFTDSRYTFQAAEEVAGPRIHIAKHGLVRAASGAIRKKGRRRVGYSLAHVSVAQHNALKASADKGVRWVPDGDSVEKLRAVKDGDELATMREAANVISGVFADVVEKIRPDATELEIAAEIEHAIKRRGGSGASFETIVASGPRSTWAHARPSENRLGKSGLVVLDQGAIIRGYCSDMTRTVSLGRASNDIRHLYEAVLDAQKSAKKAVRAGVKAGDVDAAARKSLKQAGLAQYFTHSTGHGLGLEVHEMPRLGRGETTVLQEGMVVTVEPGVYAEGLGGVRIEDDVVVTADGCADLTTARRDLLEL